MVPKRLKRSVRLPAITHPESRSSECDWKIPHYKFGSKHLTTCNLPVDVSTMVHYFVAKQKKLRKK